MPEFGMDTRVKPAYDGQETCIEFPELPEFQPGKPNERPPHRPSAAALQAHAAVSARQGQDALPQDLRRWRAGRARAWARRCWWCRARRCGRWPKPPSPTSIICCAPRIWRGSKRIVEDPEASDNDKFVAYDFLKNANIAAGGVLPMCQDTGTALIMGKKGRLVWTDGRRRGGARRGRARRLPQAQSALFAARAALDVRGEEHQLQHAGAGRDLSPRATGDADARLQVFVHRQRRRLGQQGVSVPGDAVDPVPRTHARLPERESADARHRGLPALPSRHRHRRHLGRDDDEDGQARLLQILRHAAGSRLRGRPCLPRQGDGAGNSEDDAVARRRRAIRRQIFLPRRARDPAAAPRRVAADRARRVVLGRPPGARQDHPRRRVPRRARAQSGEISAGGRHREARRRGGEDRPQQADAGDLGAARQISDQDAAVAVRPDDRGARCRARQAARAAGDAARRCPIISRTIRSITRGRRRRRKATPRARSARPRPAAWIPSSPISRPPAARW